MYKEQIRAYLEKNKENIVANLCELVRIPSVTGTKHCITALHKCEEMLESVCEKTETFEDRLYSLGEIDGHKKIGIFTHCDVVPADEAQWNYLPFEPTRKGNCLIGRGVEDDKGGFIQALYALKCIKELNLPFNSGVTFFVGGTEEAGGMEDIISFTKNHPMPNISFSPDCDFPFSMGEKSMIHIKVRAKKSFESIENFEGGTVMNAVPSSANAKLLTGEEVKAEGIGAHAAMPEGSKSAIKELSNMLIRNENVSLSDKEILREIALLQSDFYGSYLEIATEEEGFGKLTCVMGKAFCEDKKVNFTLDIRFGASTDLNATANHIKTFLDIKGFELISIDLSQGFTLNNHPAKDVLEKVYTDFGFKEKPFISAGGTYSRHLKNSFSIGVVCGENEPDIIMPEGRGGIHQSDEMICIDRLLNGINVFVNYLLSVDKII